MHRYPFIFSSERKYRVQRHVVFWACWWLFSTILYSFSAFAYNLSYLKRLPFSAIESFLFLAPHMFLSYTLMYWVLPKFLLQGKYAISVVAVLFLFLVSALISAFIGINIIENLKRLVINTVYTPPPHINNINLFNSLLAGLRGAITIGGLAATIKLMKYWYLKEQRNVHLQKENAESQLQLLKAQVHPHFLFNTMNNIYSYTQNTSPTASKLVMGLSDMLRYMLYECNQPLVPLKKELKMLKDYMLLEEVRYQDRIDLHIDFPDDSNDLYIAPLLLLPFIENCFKHGASQALEQPWVSLHISLHETDIEMKLVNGKAENKEQKSVGIGITNVQKRLELLYPGKHTLNISQTEDVYIVNLKLSLERIAIRRETKNMLVEA